MRKYKKQLIKLTAKEILFSIFDFASIGIEAFFHRNLEVLRAIRAYHKQRDIDKSDFYKKIWRYKKQGFIQEYKKNQYRLTAKGENCTLKYLSGYINVEPQEHWDRLWRIVIFDIPEDNKYFRNILRLKLKQIGFYQLQKSVWIYPYDCSNVVKIFKKIYRLEPYIQFIVAKYVESDVDLINYFFDKKTLKHLTKPNNK